MVDLSARVAAMTTEQLNRFDPVTTENHVRNRGFPQHGDPTDQDWMVAKLWPEPPKPRVPEYLPDAVLRPFIAGEKALPQEGLRDAAAGQYRKALDTGTKMIASAMPNAAEYEKRLLKVRLDMLERDGRLTPELAEWAHHIRDVGNDAVHELDEISEAELTALRGFTELVLTYLFTLPGMLAARKADADKVKG